MKKIKFVFLVLILLFISGCDVTYEITIKNNKIKEKVSIVELNQSIFDKKLDTGWTLRESFELYANSDEFAHEDYKVKSSSNNNRLALEYKSKDSTTILNSSFLNLCYTKPTVSELDGVITIDTGKNFQCYEYYENLDNIKIILKTNHEVVSTNAHEIEGDKYIWNITSNSDKNIKISYYEKEDSRMISPLTIALFAIVIIVAGVVIHFVRKKNLESNSI